MKKYLFALILSIGLLTPKTTSSAQSLIVLHPNESYKAPPNNSMVVMDNYTFGNYHYTASKYDTLKKEVKRLDSALVQQDSNQCQLSRNYESVLLLKNSEITTYQQSYQRLENTTNECIKQQNQLQISYTKLEQKNSRLKKWRNWFMGSTACLGAIIVLAVVR